MNAESLNRIDLTEDELAEHIALQCKRLIVDGKPPLSMTFTAQALKATIPQVAGRIPNEAFVALVGLCVSLMWAATIEMVDDMDAAIDKARKEPRS